MSSLKNLFSKRKKQTEQGTVFERYIQGNSEVTEDSMKEILNELKGRLDSKLLEVNNMKNQMQSMEELIGNYKEQLRHSERKEGTVEVTDADTYVGTLKAEISRLNGTLKEIKRQDQEVQELKLTVKLMESEMNKQSIVIQDQASKLDCLNGKLEDCEGGRQELNIELYRLQLELGAEARNSMKMNFQKESIETELKSVKERLGRTRLKLEKTQNTVLGLQTELNSKTDEIHELKNTLETQIKMFQEDIHRANANCEGETKGNLIEIESLEGKLTQENAELVVALSALQTSNEKLKTEQELANAEIVSLSQKLENKKRVASKPEFRLFAANPFKDNSLILQIKGELDEIYKNLMNLMSTSPPNSVEITISSSKFSVFESRLNNLLMQVHEFIESPTHNTKVKLAVTINQTKNRKLPKNSNCLTTEGEVARRSEEDQGTVTPQKGSLRYGEFK